MDCAYVTLLYGANQQYALGAVTLGQSIAATGSRRDRVLLHTHDVPKETRRLLAEFWDLREVPYIMSAPDLHTAPYEKARFKEVFTKLQAINPEVVPYDRVVFLDLDTIVLRNIDDLFELRPPAALSNYKTNTGRMRARLKHGERMDPHYCYFNAGCMVLAPSRPLFELLAADVQAPDPIWHRPAWSPEQNYLSLVLAGEWSHISHVYNLEVQLHSGVPVSKIWEEAQAADVAVAHFSGKKKVWDCDPTRDPSAIGNAWSKETFAHLGTATQCRTWARSQALHAEWHRLFADACALCRARGLGPEAVGARLDAVLRTGDPGAAEGAAGLGKRIGSEVVITDADGTRWLGKVLRTLTSKGAFVVWRHAPPSASSPAVLGRFGSCWNVQAAKVTPLCLDQLTADFDHDRDLDVGEEAVAWTGAGHARGVVAARSGDLVCMAFDAAEAPRWIQAAEVRRVTGTGGEHRDGDQLQCASCLSRAAGEFIALGRWRCVRCREGRH